MLKRFRQEGGWDFQDDPINPGIIFLAKIRNDASVTLVTDSFKLRT